MPSNVFAYPPIAQDSNYAPIAIELRDGRTNAPVDLTGSTVSVNVRDETTGETIVADGIGTVSTTNTNVAEYFYAAIDVARIVYATTWLVEWTITHPSGRVFRQPEPYRQPVRPRL